jgi:hypothetical protein
MFRDVVAEHHVMQAAQRPFVVLEVGIVRELQHVAHCVAIARDRLPGLGTLIERLFAVHGRDRVIDRDVIALDAVRALDCPRKRRPSQQPGPTARLPLQQITQPIPQPVNALDYRGASPEVSESRKA